MESLEKRFSRDMDDLIKRVKRVKKEMLNVYSDVKDYLRDNPDESLSAANERLRRVIEKL